VLRTAGGTETTEENIQDLLELDKGNTKFQPQTEEEIAEEIFFIYFYQYYPYY
jgi:hypothetical protein